MENQQLSIGEESMQWAEKYWHLDKVCKSKTAKMDAEEFNYQYFRDVFVKKIDEAIAERLNPTPQPEQDGNVFEL